MQPLLSFGAANPFMRSTGVRERCARAYEPMKLMKSVSLLSTSSCMRICDVAAAFT
jgi:hypothetical protein